MFKIAVLGVFDQARMLKVSQPQVLEKNSHSVSMCRYNTGNYKVQFVIMTTLTQHP